jgi:hypothetical protein
MPYLVTPPFPIPSEGRVILLIEHNEDHTTIAVNEDAGHRRRLLRKDDRRVFPANEGLSEV